MKQFIITLTLTLASAFAFAADNTVTTSEKKSTDRAGKNWTVVGQLTGITSKVGSESGIAAGFFIDQDSVLLLEAYGTEENGFWHNLDSDVNVNSRSVAVMYKKFMGNSFYFKGGVVGRTVDYSNYEVPQDEKFKGTAISGSVGIGNQWQIKNFTLGADWISFTQPISTNITSEQAYDTTDYAQNSLKDAKKTYLEDSYTQFVRFYIGASF